LTNVRPCLPADPDAPPPVLPYALTDGEQVLLWILDPHYNYPDGALETTPRVLSGGHVVLPGLPAGRYTVEWWDSWEGKPADSTDLRVARDGNLHVALPDFQVDIAARINRQK
jgi:hypothetical protein